MWGLMNATICAPRFANAIAEGLAAARVDGAHGLDLRLEVGHDNVHDVRLRRDVVAP